MLQRFSKMSSYVPLTMNKRLPSTGPRTKEPFPIVPFEFFSAFSNSAFNNAVVRFEAVALRIIS